MIKPVLKYAVFAGLFSLLGFAMYQLPKHYAIQPGLNGCHTIEATSAVRKCLVNRGKDIAGSDGVNALATAIDKAGSNQKIQQVCHSAMHKVGQAVGERAASDKKKQPPYLNGRKNCSQGISHGLIIGFLGHPSRAALLAFDPKHSCPGGAPGTSETPNKNEALDLVNCVHSLGHSAYRSNKSLPFNITVCESALTRLSGTTPDPLLAGHCFNGILMQQAISHPSKATTCPSTTGKAKVLRYSCLNFLAQDTVTAGKDVRLAARSCARIAENNTELETCARGLGQTAVRVDTCKLLPLRVQAQCTAAHEEMWAS